MRAAAYLCMSSRACPPVACNVAAIGRVDSEPHVEFKRRVPLAIGLIRTGDATQYANMIIESA
jgi:D-ribose pyranose/furanose isomerase RbsD